MQQFHSALSRFLAGAAVVAALGGQAIAQVALFDEPALLAACQLDACVPEVEATLGRLGDRNLPEPEFNSQIGFLAAILLQSAETAQADRLPQIGAALDVLGRSSTDARQSAAIGQVAQAVARGEAASVAASAPYAASPSRPVRWWNRPRRPSRSDRFRGRSRSR